MTWFKPDKLKETLKTNLNKFDYKEIKAEFRVDTSRCMAGEQFGISIQVPQIWHHYIIVSQFPTVCGLVELANFAGFSRDNKQYNESYKLFLDYIVEWIKECHYSKVQVILEAKRQKATIEFLQEKYKARVIDEWFNFRSGNTLQTLVMDMWDGKDEDEDE